VQIVSDNELIKVLKNISDKKCKNKVLKNNSVRKWTKLNIKKLEGIRRCNRPVVWHIAFVSGAC